MDDLSTNLRTAIAGLLYPSDSDEPFSVFSWPATNGTAAEAVANHAASGRIAPRTFDEFFGELRDDQRADRFAALRQILEANLTGLAVFIVGDGSERGVYIIGKSQHGAWFGVETLSVET